MIYIGLQFFGGRGSGGGKGGGGGGGAIGGAQATDAMTRIERQISATEQRIKSLEQRQAQLDSQIPSLVRARNYDQIRSNNREGERLAKEVSALRRELNNLHQQGRAVYRD